MQETPLFRVLFRCERLRAEARYRCSGIQMLTTVAHNISCSVLNSLNNREQPQR